MTIAFLHGIVTTATDGRRVTESRLLLAVGSAYEYLHSEEFRMLVVPRWSAEGIKDWHQLFVVNADGEKEPNSITAALINYTPIIGISEITEENIDEVSCRVALFEAIFGPLLISNNAPRFLSRQEIARHVGLCTEAHPLPLEEFWKKMLLANRRKNGAEEKGTTGI